MDKDRLNGLESFERIISYSFRDKGLLNTALIHRSFVNESPAENLSDNERLEFLGDAVLELCISHLLMEKFPDAMEGQLSRMRASIVNEQSLAQLAKQLRFGEFILLGKGESTSGGKMKPSILSNAFEAVVAALYLDCGFERAYTHLKTLFSPLVDACDKSLHYRDYKTSLQEICQSRYKAVPKYSLINEFGPEHDKVFEIRLCVSDILSTIGVGKNKKEAEQEAAKKALDVIGGTTSNPC
jgi:ribonuclease III